MELTSLRLSQQLKLKSGVVYPVGKRASITFEGQQAKLEFSDGTECKIQARRLPHFFEDNFEPEPDEDTLEQWCFDGACETVTGHQVEPDGFGPDGSPSWLLALGLI